MHWLEAEDISFHYDQAEVLEGVSMHVDSGEVVSLLGPSGCGKTTLLNLIAGLLPMQQGEIRINGSAVANNKQTKEPQQRGIGMVFQQASLFPHMTVLDNVTFALHGHKKAERNKMALQALRLMSIDHLVDFYPHMLSGGQQQRAAIARALALKPKLMLLDEPFANLDTVMRRQVREETMLLMHELDIATVFVTHDPEEAIRMSDRIYVMEQGRIIQSGSPEDLYHKPASPFVASLYGELNEIEGRMKAGKLETPFGAHTRKGKAGKVNCYIRPEGIEIRKTKKNAIEATIFDMHFLGEMRLVYIELKESGKRFRMRCHHSVLQDAQMGDALFVGLNPDHVFIF